MLSVYRFKKGKETIGEVQAESSGEAERISGLKPADYDSFEILPGRTIVAAGEVKSPDQAVIDRVVAETRKTTPVPQTVTEAINKGKDQLPTHKTRKKRSDTGQSRKHKNPAVPQPSKRVKIRPPFFVYVPSDTVNDRESTLTTYQSKIELDSALDLAEFSGTRIISGGHEMTYEVKKEIKLKPMK